MKKKFLLKILLFVSPFVMAVVAELWLLPIGTFSTQAATSLAVRHHNLFPGPYYPDMDIEMDEVGTLAPHTDRAVKKRVRWVTDRYGFRKRNTNARHRIVIVGDSMTTGLTLSQDDMLTEALERVTGKSTYPFSPRTLNDFHISERFQAEPPDVVVRECYEQFLFGMRPAGDDPDWVSPQASRKTLAAKAPAIVRSFDRFTKQNALFHLRDAMRVQLNPENQSHIGGEVAPGQPMLFSHSTRPEVTDEKIAEIVTLLKAHADMLAERGIRFVFMPIPSKESIYHKLMSDGRRPTFIPRLVVALKKAGVEAVDIQSVFERVLQGPAPPLLYHTDDAHWTPAGARLAAEALAEALIRLTEHQ